MQGYVVSGQQTGISVCDQEPLLLKRLKEGEEVDS